MARPKSRLKPLDPNWEIPDESWVKIEPIIKECWPNKATAQDYTLWRKMLNAILFRMRSGCSWDQLPARFGPKLVVHDWFKWWSAGGDLEKIKAVLIAEGDQLGAGKWEWQSADAMLGKTRFGGEKDGEEPHQSREKGDQEESPDRQPERPAGRRERAAKRTRKGTDVKAKRSEGKITVKYIEGPADAARLAHWERFWVNFTAKILRDMESDDVAAKEEGRLPHEQERGDLHKSKRHQ
ncbi:transposase [Singulisphaera acidiphila]|uniref:transposase n=1 Tax=Singulisphaera acidiphila TaxID=466153 RepID=UPI0002DB8F51|nr:transposase [Singulisphaera acidiphila]